MFKGVRIVVILYFEMKIVFLFLMLKVVGVEVLVVVSNLFFI